MAGALLIYGACVASAHAEPVAEAQTAHTAAGLIASIPAWLVLAGVVLGGIGGILGGLATVLRVIAPRTPTKWDDNVLAAIDSIHSKVDTVHAKLDTLTAAIPASQPATTTVVVEASKAGPALGLLLVLLTGAAATLPGCGTSAAQRTSALAAALVTVEASAKAFEAYDGQHQAAISKAAADASAKAQTRAEGQAVLDAGRAQLAAYQAKQGTVSKAFTAAYLAIAAAATLNDDPSLAGAEDAVKQLLAVVRAVTGGAP